MNQNNKIINKSNIYTFLISISLFLFIDFIFGNKISDVIYKPLNPTGVEQISDSLHHHKLQENFNQTITWNKNTHKLCTDHHGHKISCKNFKKDISDYNFALIGDSFTEGIGLNHEDTFVGHLEDLNPDLKFLNLGIRSYSNIIYLNRIKEILDKKYYNFDELILLADLSDIQDDSYYYEFDETGNRVISQAPVTTERLVKNNLRSVFPFTYHSLWLIKEKFSNKCNYLDKCFVRAGWPYNNNLLKNSFVRELPNNENEINLAIKTSLNYAKELAILLKKENIKLTVVVYPWPGNLYHDSLQSKYVKIWKNFCELNCDNFLNTYPKFFEIQKNQIKDFYLKNDVHFNSKGTKLIAEEITEKIILDKIKIQ